MEIPNDIRRYGKIVRQLDRLLNPNPAERELLNYARLKLAVWACDCEKIPSSRENLAGILGKHAPDAMECFSKLHAEGCLKRGARFTDTRRPPTNASRPS